MARKTSKRTLGLREQFSAEHPCDLLDALRKAKESATAKFDESVDIAVNLGIDARKSEQAVRGAFVLPHGIGKSVRVAVFAEGQSAADATEAGADIVGQDFDRVVLI
jgi:large subunit ribosomal protein L1